MRLVSLDTQTVIDLDEIVFAWDGEVFLRNGVRCKLSSIQAGVLVDAVREAQLAAAPPLKPDARLGAAGRVENE